MKNSYHIIGLHLDGQPECTSQVKTIPWNGEIPTLDTPPTLFDRVTVERTILMSELFGIDNDTDSSLPIDTFSECDQIDIFIDNKPLIAGKIHERFYALRASQCIRLVQESYPHARVTVMKTPFHFGLKGGSHQ